MAKQQTITITVNPDGDTRIEAEGFENNECLKATETIEAALGKIQARSRKAQAYTTKAGVKLGST